MNRHVNSIALMLVTQACCVALGLHLHDSYLRESVERGDVKYSENNHMAGEAIANAQPLFRLLTVAWILLMQIFVAFLTLSRIYREIGAENDALRVRALTRERQVRKTRDALIFGLAALAESRDPETGKHLERISLYSRRLATEVSRRKLFPEVLTREFLRTIGPSSTLHDIGKVSVRDNVLRKPGALTAEERQHIQTHTTVGGECIRAVEAQTGDTRFLRMAREIALHHHERWDGCGYPQHLKGESIPLAARIVAIADVYDALSVRRTYKAAYAHERCVQMIADGAGTQFDPVLVDAFLAIEADFAFIATQHSPDDELTLDGHVLPAIDDNLMEELDGEWGDEVIPLSLLLSSIQSQSASSRDEQQQRVSTPEALPASPSA